MRKLVFLLLFCLFGTLAYANPITVDQFISPDSVTIEHLEQLRSACIGGINNADGNLLQSRTVSEDKLTTNADVTLRWDETFNDYVYSGILPPTSVNLTSTTTSGTAYVAGDRVVKDTTAHTYAADTNTYVDLKNDGSFTYTEVTPDVAPVLATNTVRLARVMTDSSKIYGVTDLRILSVTVENRQADFYRKSMNVTASSVTTDTVRVYPGVVYWGNVRISKITTTTLVLGTAGDWVTGGGSATDNTMGFVVISNAGVIQMTTTAPGYHDLAGTTAGTKYYSKIGANYYRVLAWFYMDDTFDATVKINPWGWGNFDMPWGVKKHVSPDTTTSSKVLVDVVEQEITFYSSGGRTLIIGNAGGYNATQYYGFSLAINLDGTDLQETRRSCSSVGVNNDSAGGAVTATYVTPELEQGNHIVKLRWLNDPVAACGPAHITQTNITVEEN